MLHATINQPIRPKKNRGTISIWTTETGLYAIVVLGVLSSVSMRLILLRVKFLNTSGYIKTIKIAIDPNSSQQPPSANMIEPKTGPARKPSPVKASVKPMFCSRSCTSEHATTQAIRATDLIPDPMPPTNCEIKDIRIKMSVSFKVALQDNPTSCKRIKTKLIIMAFSRPTFLR